MIEKGNMTDAEFIAALIAENKKLKAEQAKLEKAIDILETKKEKLSLENECLKRDCHIYLEALILSKHKIFGKTSEHTEDEGQQTFFNEAEVEYTEKTEEPVSKMVKGYTRKSPKTKRDELIRNIETEVITCTIPDEEQICPRCGSEMKVIGRKYVREVVELIPAKLIVKKYYSNTYSCKKCEKKNMPVFLHGFVPAPVLPHSLASASTVSWVIYQKYVNAVPLYRQEKDLERLGYTLSRTTMANWIIRCSEDYFGRLIARLKSEMLKEKVLHCDETYVKVLREKDVADNSKQYMWVYRTGKYSERQIVIYDYNKSRSGDVAKKFLGDFSGYLHTDGYAGYNKLTKVKHCNYWAHLRRKFHEAIVVDSEDSIAKTGREFCDKLFSIEAELNSLTSEERYNKRLTQEKEVFEAFWSWAEKIYPTVLSKTQLGKAFDYTFKRREYLGNYFENGNCAISNNIAENAIRPFTVGRKNWLFSDTPKGAKASADVYSIVETAKANGLDVFKYFELLLTVLPSMAFLTNPDILEELLPWNRSVQKICKAL
ncbi:IS66 family transposase [uncultured Ruminococcus sp.]|uniref:IS66 family transposase n=1 Tax=uncultured Ruminococcus sp. TaxID=165186 RepID=UPI00260F1199|nr:IS66 family transposase [uncultured Ruminococcus sp.]